MQNFKPVQRVFFEFMRITFIHLTVTITTVLLVKAGEIPGQTLLDKKILIEAKNESAKSVLSRIEKQASVTFSYKAQLLRTTHEVTIAPDSVTVKMALDLIFNRSVTYEIVRNQILLIKSDTFKKDRGTDAVINITGVVTEENGEPLPGVNVLIKGTTTGTTTDGFGRYTINAPDATSVLVFSFIGYGSLEIRVGEQTQIDVQLLPDVKALEEVVVVGYGTVKKGDITGSVASIGTQELKAQPINSFNQALQGRVSGVQVTQSSNAPGGGITIRIRGGNSISANNDPLYVIDGFPVTNPAPASGARNSAFFPNPLSTINPNDIESIEVLKDASATAIYGSRGANGVVLVTTRRGKAGKANVDFEAYYGVQKITKMLDLVTAEQHTLLKNEQLRNLGFAERYGNPAGSYPKTPAEYGKGTDWQDEIYRTAPMQNYQLSFSGGDERLRYIVSNNYFNQDGIVINNNFKRYSTRVNLDLSISDRINVSNNFTIAHSINNGVNEIGSNGVVGAALSVSPASPVFDANGNYQLLNVGPGSGYSNFPNPVAMAETSTNVLVTDRVMGNIASDFSIVKGLTARVSVGVDIYNTRRNIFYTPETLIANTVNGYGSNGTSRNINLLNENTLTYTRSINSYGFDIVAGVTFQSNKEERTYAEAQDFPNYSLGANNLGLANKPLPSSGSVQEWGLNSYLARINYRFQERYLLTLTGRVDGSSVFGANNKYGFFPSSAFAWRISEESFLRESRSISDMKIRVSYGLTGNNGIGLYNSLSQYSTSRTIFGDTEVIMSQASRIANPDLRWEKTAQFDAGIDLGVINNRFQVTADYYIKTTTDLLLGVQLPATTGFTSVTRNVGSMENRGFEFGVNSTNIDRELKWKTNGNISFNRNKVIKLHDADQFLVSSTFGTGTSIVKAGESVGSFYGNVFDGIWQTAEEISAAGAIARAGDLPGALRYKDLNGDGIFNESTDRQILGTGLPKFIYGLTNNFSFRGFDLSVFIQGVSGNSILNWTRRSLETSDPSSSVLKTVYEGAWRADKPSTTLPSIRQWRPTNTDSFFIEDGSFLRLKNVSIGYQIPFKNTIIKKARVYISGQNLYTFTDYRGYDPEVNSDFNSNTSYGVDVYAYPAARTYTIGGSFTF